MQVDSMEINFRGTDNTVACFIKHISGESTWNDTFNKGDRKMTSFLISFIPNLLKAFGTEWYFMVSGESDER